MKIGDVEIESVKVLSLQPNDILVIRSVKPIPVYEGERIKGILREKFGIENKILVTPSDIDIEIVRRESS